MEQSEPISRFDAAPIVAVMTRDEAEQCEREIITTGNRLRRLFLEFYERRGWEVLGYSSWDTWAATVLPASMQHAYRELTAGIAEKVLTHGLELGTVPERQLRPLGKLIELPRGQNDGSRTPVVDEDGIRDSWERAQELAAEEGRPLAARHVTTAVNEYLNGAPPVQAPTVTRFNEGLRSSTTGEWYTPLHIITIARTVMGDIDLDPASCHAAQVTIQAAQWFGLDHVDPAHRDGLDREWPGRVWLNPPYGDVIGDWVARLVHQYDMEITTEALALLPARLDTAWWQDNLARFPFCVIRGRLRFSNAGDSAPFPSVVVYLGASPDVFTHYFSDIGLVYRPM